MIYALDYSLDEWQQWCQKEGYPRYVAQQIYDWIFNKKHLDPLCFSNLSFPLREALANSFVWELLTLDTHLISKDGSEKFLLKTHDGLLMEMVLMHYDARTTLCISSQVGCRMGCTFCQTGKMGFKRNLSSGEILAQLHHAMQRSKQRITNIVFMGMGEPLDNYEQVVKACRIMIDPKGYALSKNRVTVSTSGLIPEIERLGRDLPVRLAISLHSAEDEKRSAMMPINRKYPLEKLKQALLNYPAPSRFGITLEYVLIEGENDHIAHAKKLVKFIHGLKVKVNLIPLNAFPGVEMNASSAERIQAFQRYLTDRSIPAPVRYSRGQDISGGCGQLAAKRADELDDHPTEVHKRRRAKQSLQQV